MIHVFAGGPPSTDNQSCFNLILTGHILKSIDGLSPCRPTKSHLLLIHLGHTSVSINAILGSSLASMLVKLTSKTRIHHPTLIHFDTIPACGGQTDGLTDRQKSYS